MVLLRCALACLLMQPASAAPPQPAAPVLAKVGDCGDFLATMGRKPAHLIYEGCRYHPDLQSKPLVATYRVNGRHAASVARALRRSTGMNRVEKYCCQWEALRSQFVDSRGQDYSILMVSEETVHLTREAWPKINRFEVVVETYTEEL